MSNKITKSCSNCQAAFEFSRETEGRFCPICGTEVDALPETIVSMARGDALTGGYIVENYLEHYGGWLFYHARSTARRKVRIREAVYSSDLSHTVHARFSLGSVPILPDYITSFCLGNRLYLIDEHATFETGYFSGVRKAEDLIVRTQAILAELDTIHKRGWCVFDILQGGIFLSDELTPLIGKVGNPYRIGVPVHALPEYLREGGPRIVPSVAEPAVDLLVLVHHLWEILATDESWEEVWGKAAQESQKAKRREVFYHALVFSPRVIEWPPLGEVLSDFLSDPLIWSAAELGRRLGMNLPTNSTIIEVKSHRGLKRANNEDAVIANQYELWLEGIPTKVWLFAVADGMGGVGSGEIAARITVEAVDRFIHDVIARGELEVTPAHLKSAIALANEEVVKARKDPRYDRNMGSTVICGVLMGSKYIVAWVGDSRGIQIQKSGASHQVTQDHSFLAELIKGGGISEVEAQSHPMAGRLTRAIGLTAHVDVDVRQGELKPGEALLLISDGYNSAVRDYNYPMDEHPKEILDALTVRMLKDGGIDNASAVMIKR
ncbi:MAG: serine/threonine-protein phosphatase [Bdellovibrionales bacterium]|nr:serine/threonine-protein phosphatase [Bdellovibrionales bacterium]